MKKIAVDVTSLSDQYRDHGIGVYTDNILFELIKWRGVEWHLIGFNNLTEDFTKNKNVIFHSIGNVYVSDIRNTWTFKRDFIPLVKRIKPSLYFCPNFERGIPLGICKIAVMIHDISPLIQNKYSSKGPIANCLKGLFYKYNLNKAKKAELILTNSNYTKSDIVKIGFDEKRIVTTYLGVTRKINFGILKEKDIKRTILEKYNISKPYILYYGGIGPNKNVPLLLEVFKKLLKKSPNLKLVIFDKDISKRGNDIKVKSNLGKEIQKKIEKLGIQDSIILPGFFNYKEIPVVLNESSCFVHLSSYEGFGLSVVEALASGACVIASNKSCYPEIVGDGGILVDINKTNDLVKVIEKVITEKKFREKIVSRGKLQAKKFTWEKCAKKTINAFLKLL